MPVALESPPASPPALTMKTGSQIDSEEEELSQSLGDDSSSIFSEFMLRIAKYEELVDVAYKLLVGFHQEIETFKKPQLCRTSDLVDHIIEANQTERMKAYVEAGCRHRYKDIQNITKLYSCRRGLEDHLGKAKSLLDEVKLLKENAIGIAKSVYNSTSKLLSKSVAEVMRNDKFCLEEEDAVESARPEEKPTSHAILMSVIYNMLNLDYIMQENIIKSINSASSDQLESYCFMWELRPYINDDIMQKSWRIVSR